MIASEAPHAPPTDLAVTAGPDVRILRAGLRALARALESRSTLADLTVDFVRSIDAALDGARVEICLAGETLPLGNPTFVLELDDAKVATLVVLAGASPVSPSAREALQLLAAPLAIAVAHRRRGGSFRNARDPARIDALCGIPNRLAFDERLDEMSARCSERGAPIAVALFDIDFFKAYNDAYGHLGGDRALRDVAALLANRRAGDARFCARYGGEEFVMLFADATLEEATEEVRAILERLEASNIEHGQTTLGRISVSVGIAATIARGRGSLDLLAEADRALFRAKRLGRNRICAGTFVSGGVAVARRVARSDGERSVVGPTFGRENDISRIAAALRHARMVTLVGPEGIGKSRLVAYFSETPSLVDRRVIFVESAILRAGTDAASALASAFDLPIDSGDALEAVTNYLDERDALLVFDRDEHVGVGIRELCEHLIARTANVSIVANGRSPLGIAGERWLVVAPLDDESAIDQLASLCGAERSACAEIVPFLGGNPASIERAAAYVARVGHEPLARRLFEGGVRFSSVLDLDTFLSQGDP